MAENYIPALIAKTDSNNQLISSAYGSLVSVTVELTLPDPAAAYVAGDAVNDSAATPHLLEFQNLARIAGGTVYLVGIRMAMNKKSQTPKFRLHFFNASNPTALVGDNLAWKELYADTAKRLGYYELPAMTTAADTTNSNMSRVVDLNVPRIPLICATGTRSIWLGHETLDAWTPDNGMKISTTLVVDLN